MIIDVPDDKHPVMYVWGEMVPGIGIPASKFSQAVYDKSTLGLREFEAARLRIANPLTWLGAVSATSGVVAMLRQHAKSLVFSAGRSIAHGLDIVAAMSRRRDTGIRA